MTFDKAGSELPEQPRNIDKLGYRDSFHYSTLWKGKEVQKRMSAIAYKSGTGNAVALSFSTIDSGFHWDMVPISDHHLKWYFLKDISRHEKNERLSVA